jgi:integrase
MKAKKPYTIVFSKSLSTWHLRWYENGIRKSKQIGDIRDLPTLEAAKKKAAPLVKVFAKPVVPLVRDIAAEFVATEMSERFSTRRSCQSWMNNHILPKWGDSSIAELQALEVRDWLRSLVLSPKSRSHIKALIGQLWTHAMLHRYVESAVNPMTLFRLKGAAKEKRKPRSLTVEQFRWFVAQLEEPLRTVALVCVCLGLRISECMALRWSDVDWLQSTLSVERGIVSGRVGELKTEGSRRKMAVAPEMLGVLSAWRRTTEFSEPTDWIFASPASIGRKPISYPWVWTCFQAAAEKAKVGKFGTHTMRHSYRSWLDAAGTPIAVQQKLMRHSDIRTTMNTYGEVVTDELKQANSKVAIMALRRA